MAADRKEFKFGIEQKDYPKRLLKDLEQHISKISKDHRAIPKSLNDWKKELSFIKYEASDLTTKLERQQRVVAKLSAAFKTLKGKDRQISQVELDKAQRKMESLQNRMDKQTRMVASVGTYTAAQQTAVDRAGGGMMVGGVMKKLAPIGVAAGAAYVGYKAVEKIFGGKQTGMEYRLQGLKLGRQANLQYSLEEAILTGKVGAEYKKTPQQMMEAAGAMYGTTGAYLLQSPQVLEQFAGFVKKQGLEYGTAAGMLGAGVRAGVVRGGGEERAIATKGYFDLYAKAMEQGVNKGFSKNERINQLIQLTRIGTKVTGEITKEGFSRLTASYMALEKFGGVAFRGEKGIKALEMMKGIMRPSPTTTPLFAAMSMMRVIPKEYTKGIVGRNITAPEEAGGMGISPEVYEGLLPATQWTMKQAALYKRGGLGVFRETYENLKKRQGGKGATEVMARWAGISPTSENMVTFTKLISTMGRITESEYEKIMSSFEEPAKKVSESIESLSVEMNKYLQGTVDLTKSITFLDGTIGAEVALRKYELMLAEKFRIGGGKLSKKVFQATDAEMAVYEQMLPMMPAASQTIIKEEMTRRREFAKSPAARAMQDVMAGGSPLVSAPTELNISLVITAQGVEAVAGGMSVVEPELLTNWLTKNRIIPTNIEGTP